MVLKGKVTTELGIHTTADKFFNIFAKQLHTLPNICPETVHGVKVLQGDWHGIGPGSVKEWAYTIDGKILTCKENIEAIDEQNKSISFNHFDGDVSQHYIFIKITLQTIDKEDGGSIAIWTAEYEKIKEDIAPPYGYLDHVMEVTKDIDAHLLKA